MKIDIDVPDGQSGVWKVETFEITEQVAKFENIRTAFNSSTRYIEAGIYKRLMYKNEVMMSNTPMEIRDHLRFIYKAKESENILINGLGIGVALTEILKSEKVKRVDIVEISEDVIKLVAPTYTKDPRVNIIHADALDYLPEKGVRYGAVWHDVWMHICSDNLPDMKKLHRRYGKRCEWQGSWGRELCEIQRSRWG